MNNNKARIEWIDVAKGLLIFFVVYGHCSQYRSYNKELISFMRRAIYTFHMPGFFFISGLLVKGENVGNLLDIVKKKYIDLLVPGYLGMVVIVIYYSFEQGTEYLLDFFNICNLVKQFFWKSDAKLEFWFLGTLFSVFIMSFIIHRKAVIRNLAFPVSVYVMCMGMIIVQLNPDTYKWPFSIIQAMVSLPFFEMAVLLKNNICTMEGISIKNYIALLMSGGLCIFASIYNPFRYNISVWCAGVGDMQWYIVGGLSGALMIIELAKILSSMDVFLILRKFIAFAGKNSLNVYIFHRTAINVFLAHTNILDHKIPILDTYIFFFAVLIVAVLAILSQMARSFKLRKCK